MEEVDKHPAAAVISRANDGPDSGVVGNVLIKIYRTNIAAVSATKCFYIQYHIRYILDIRPVD